jgi:hypothetical protein
VKALKAKSYKDCHAWYLQNTDVEFTALVRDLYDTMKDSIAGASVPAAVLIFNDFLCRQSVCADIEIHAMAMFIALMSDLEWR